MKSSITIILMINKTIYLFINIFFEVNIDDGAPIIQKNNINCSVIAILGFI